MRNFKIMFLIVPLQILLSYANANIVEFRKYKELNTYSFSKIAADNFGNVLIAGGKNIIRINENSIDSIVTNLSGDITQSVTVDKKNNIWVGTKSGTLLKYNGSTWFKWTGLGVKAGASYGYVPYITTDSNNNVWGIGGGALYKYNGTSWNVTIPKFDAFKSATKVVCHNDTLWCGINSAGLFYYYNNIWGQIKIAGQSSNLYKISSIAIDKNGVKWVALDDSGVFKLDGTSWTKYYSSKYPFLKNSTDISVDNAGNVWVCTSNNGIASFDGNNWKNSRFENGLYSNNYDQITADFNNNIWIRSYRNITKIKNNDIINYISENTLPGDNIYTLFFDSKKRMWISTNKCTKVMDSTGVAYTYSNVNIANIKDIKEDLLGNIWLASANGVYKYDNTNVTNYTTTNGIISNNVYKILVDGENNKWFATASGVSKYNNIKWINYSSADGLPFTNVNNIDIDNKGRIWVSSPNAGVISYFDGATWNTVTPSFANYSGAQFLTIDLNNTIWLGTYSNGLYSYDGTTWTNFDKTNILLDNMITGLFTDSQNNLLFTNNNTEVKLTGTTLTPLPSFEDNFYLLTIDNAGYLWGNSTIIRRVGDANPYLKLSNHYVNLLPNKGNIGYFTILTSNTNWNISSSSDWLSVSATSGIGFKKISVQSTKENTAKETREAIITISGNGLHSQQVIVYQKGNGKNVGIAENIEFKYQIIGKTYVFNSEKISAIKIITLDGKEIRSTTQNSINTEGLHNGIYFIAIRTKGGLFKNIKILVCD